MAKNSYFRDVSSENDLLHDLTIESIKIHGRDMVYTPSMVSVVMVISLVNLVLRLETRLS